MKLARTNDASVLGDPARNAAATRQSSPCPAHPWTGAKQRIDSDGQPDNRPRTGSNAPPPRRETVPGAGRNLRSSQAKRRCAEEAFFASEGKSRSEISPTEGAAKRLATRGAKPTARARAQPFAAPRSLLHRRDGCPVPAQRHHRSGETATPFRRVWAPIWSVPGG